MGRLSTKTDTKVALLEAGMDIMSEKGYSNTGIQEVLSSLGVPKGSFYHYFDSKEDFGVEIIHHFDRSYTATLMRTLRSQDKSPLERLKGYCENKRELLKTNCCRRGCFIGNLGQEMADQSEVLRKELSTVMCKWQDMFASCIDEGQQLGEISTFAPPGKLAEFFLSGLGGAIMRSKTIKTLDPLDTFMDLMFNHVLKA